MPTLLYVFAAFAFGALLALIANLLSRNRRLKDELGSTRLDNSNKQQIILTLVREKESRITAEERAENYVPVKAQDMVMNEPGEVKFRLERREQQVVEL